MKRFSFKESQLLRLREQLVRHAELRLAMASAEVARAENRVAEHIRALESLADHYMSNSNAMTLHGSTSLGMRRRLEQSRAQLDRVRDEKEEARKHLVRAKRDADSLLVLRDSRLHAHKVKQRKQQQRIIDTHSIHTWMRERRVDV